MKKTAIKKAPRKAFVVRMKPAQLDMVKRAAREDGRSASAWAAIALYRQAREELDSK